MDEMQQSAYIISQAACAIIEAMGMLAKNQQRVMAGKGPIYDDTAFDELANKYGIHHNNVIGLFHGYAR